MFIARILLPVFTITGFAICLRLLWLVLKSHDHGIYYSEFEFMEWMMMAFAPICGLGAGVMYSVLVASGSDLDEFIRDACFDIIFGGFALVGIIAATPLFLGFLVIFTSIPGLVFVLTGLLFAGPVMLLR